MKYRRHSVNIKEFVKLLNADFFVGVPDSQLKALSGYLMERYGLNPKHHIIAANEGNCVGLAAGYHLATGKIPVVYMQNSGEGNIVNPAASLMDKRVYSMPVIYVIGWRGEPGVHDEPQHIFQGQITTSLLENLGIEYAIIRKETDEDEVVAMMRSFEKKLSNNESVAFVVGKDAFEFNGSYKPENDKSLSREEAIKCIVEYTNDNPIISTTGKTSRELFEIRETRDEGHRFDFLTVGSMGHASSIALSIALQKPRRRIWCIDGDGAVLMHMGAMAVIGSIKPRNLIHIIINNGAHESVGGMPTVAGDLDITSIAKGCGYEYIVTVENLDSLNSELEKVSQKEGLALIEIKCNLESRKDLGRPTVSPLDNKKAFMNCLSE